MSGPAAAEELVPTPVGEARIRWYRPPTGVVPTVVLALGHGAGGGGTAPDLAAVAALPAAGAGFVVALVDQPWKVAGKKVAPAPKTLDLAWTALWPALERGAEGLPLAAGGRSAGARVACRTGRTLGAVAVVALAFPLHPPGRPEKSRAAELTATGLPTLVVQGGRDPFGGPSEFPPDTHLIEIPEADHAFGVAKRAALTPEEAVEAVAEAVRAFLCELCAADQGRD